MNGTKEINSGKADSKSGRSGGTVTRKVADSVFIHLFKDKKYLLQLYRALHPEDTAATEDMLTNVTIENVIMNGIYNDLGFLVEDSLIILTEALAPLFSATRV